MDARAIGRLMKQISDKMEATANADLKALGLTLSQSRVLLYLDDRPEKWATQRELEHYLKVTHATVHGLLQRMEAKGMIRLSTSPEDRRLRIVHLNTDNQTLASVRTQQNDHMCKLTRGIDTQTLVLMLQQMLDNYDLYLSTEESR